MSLSIKKPWTDTPISGLSTPKTIQLGMVNYPTDFVAVSDSSDEALISNVTAPLDAPQKYKFARQDIANIYTNSGIDVNMYTPSKRGVSILCQLNSVLDVVDSTDATYRTQLPISTNVVLKFSTHELITPELVKEHLSRTLAGLFETGTDGTTRIKGMARGKLLPADVK